jgi:hypothetical protein
MKIPALLLLLAFSAPAMAAEKVSVSGEGTFAPFEKQLSSYDGLRKKSPFEFDPPKPPAVLESKPFEGISLAGYCGSGDTLTVYLLEGKEKKRITVFGDGSPFKKGDTSGFRVVGINRGRSLKTTEVVLEKDGSKGTVKFEDETLRSKPTVQGGGVQPIKGTDGKVILRPVPKPTGTPVPPVQNQGSQLVIPGLQNGPAPGGGQPGTPVNGAAVQLPADFMNSGTQQGLQNPQIVQPQNTSVVLPQNTGGLQPQGTSGKYQGRRKVLPVQ